MKVLKKKFSEKKIAFSCLAFTHHKQGRKPNYDRKQSVPPSLPPFPAPPPTPPPIKTTLLKLPFVVINGLP